MTPTQSKSKAQRRAEAQQRAAEQRAAELRKRRTRFGLRLGGFVAALAALIVIIVLVTGGSSGTPKVFTNPHVAGLEAIPSSMKSSWVQPPTQKPGPETIPVVSGPKLASLINTASGQTVDNVQCNAGEKTVAHVHTHLTIFVNGQARQIPYGIGIPGFQAYDVTGNPPAGSGPFVETGTCFYWLHVHAYDGIIHIESPSTTQAFQLGQFFDIWGQPLTTTQVGPANGKVTIFFTSPGKAPMLYTGDPRSLPLGDHYQIQLDVGTPIVAPVQVTNWGGL